MTAAVPLRLSALARALDSAGRCALPPGTALRSLELVVPVVGQPRLDPRSLWSLEVARAETPSLLRKLVRWLTGKDAWGSAPSAWPLVKLTWSDGQVYASLVPSPAPNGVLP